MLPLGVDITPFSDNRHLPVTSKLSSDRPMEPCTGWHWRCHVILAMDPPCLARRHGLALVAFLRFVERGGTSVAAVAAASVSSPPSPTCPQHFYVLMAERRLHITLPWSEESAARASG